MAIYKRRFVTKEGKKRTVCYYNFWWNGKHVQRSTKQGNPRVARNMEAAHRTALAKGEVGIREKQPVPTLGEFCRGRIEPWARATFEQASPKTWLWYRNGLRAIYDYAPLADRSLEEITSEHVVDFAAYRQTHSRRGKRAERGLEVASINASLQVVRRCLRLAVEWGIIPAAPKVKLLRGERHRERVVSPEEEARYLAAAPEPLASIAAVLIDTGMRPEECFRLRWEAITWLNGRHGSLLVTHGKTAAARRMLPMRPRVRAILESRWEAAGRPEEGWVWPAETASGHVEPSSLRKQHAKTFQTIAEEATRNNQKPVRPFVLYTLRHTFLTRLGESGCNVWALARIAGHSSIQMSARYVHPSDDAVLNALAQMQPQPGSELETASRPALPA